MLSISFIEFLYIDKVTPVFRKVISLQLFIFSLGGIRRFFFRNNFFVMILTLQLSVCVSHCEPGVPGTPLPSKFGVPLKILKSYPWYIIKCSTFEILHLLMEICLIFRNQ